MASKKAKAAEAAKKAKEAAAAKDAAKKAAKAARAAAAAAKKAASAAAKAPGVKLRCECPSDEARREFRAATTCSAKTRALDKLKALTTKDADVLKPGQKALLFRDLLRKEQQMQNICKAEEAVRTAKELEEARKDARQASYNPELDGLGRYMRRGKRRRR